MQMVARKVCYQDEEFEKRLGTGNTKDSPVKGLDQGYNPILRLKKISKS